MDSADLTRFIHTTAVDELSPTIRLSGDAFDFFSGRKGWELSEQSLAGSGVPDDPEYRWVFQNQWVIVNTDNPAAWSVYLITNKECI